MNKEKSTPNSLKRERTRKLLEKFGIPYRDTTEESIGQFLIVPMGLQGKDSKTKDSEKPKDSDEK